MFQTSRLKGTRHRATVASQGGVGQSLLERGRAGNGGHLSRQGGARGQVLVLFVLFLLVLLGISALAIDYASWLLVDRNLQNTADHAALAGASEFQDRSTATDCSGMKCSNARILAWTSLNAELGLGLPEAAITTLAAANTPAGGTTEVTVGGTTYPFGDRIWVSTPPPTYPAYTQAGGRYALNQGVVFVRVDRAVRSFLGGALGIAPDARTGWATAGALPTDLALQTFCRNHIEPQVGVCENSAGLTIDGQGSVRLLGGDIGSNESLKVTANDGAGIILEDGNMFLVNGTCQASTWNCPNGPPSLGGISDGTNGKNAFYMAPLPVPRYESPLDYAAFAPPTACPTPEQWAIDQVPCVPYQSQYGTVPATGPGDWTCGDGITTCGVPDMATSTPSCTASGGFNLDSRYLRPSSDSLASNRVHGSQFNANDTLYQNMNEATVDPGGVTPVTSPTVLAGPPTNYVWTEDNRSLTYRVGLTVPQGIPDGTNLAVRYVLFRTINGAVDTAAGATVPVRVRLVQRTGNNSYQLRGMEQSHTVTEAITFHEYAVPLSSMTGGSWYNNLYLEFEVVGTAARGMGIAWAEVVIPNLLPPTAPTIKPGFWKSITIPAGGCAILDPSPATGLQRFQLPGIFRIGGGGAGASPGIVLGSNALLIGDAVTFVFDPRLGSGGAATGFPDNGLDIGFGAALVVNTGTTTFNPSYPAIASPLPFDARNAAWQVDAADNTNPRNGENAWPVCLDGGNDCVPESCYMNTDPTKVGCENLTVVGLPQGRGISFYLAPDWGDPAIQRRFYMGGSGQTDAPGIAFGGVLYAPYDDVKIGGRNNFNTVGQVLAWTVKFHGGSAGINLDYPYAPSPAAPYLLEPTINR